MQRFCTTSSPRNRHTVALAALTIVAACANDPVAPPVDATAPATTLFGHDGVPSIVNVQVAKTQPNEVLATINGVQVFNGGFGSAVDGSPWFPRELYSLTDRGPNIAGSGADKLFPVPTFHPQIGRFRLEGDVLVLKQVITLKDEHGTPLTGLPPAGNGNSGETPRTLDATLFPNDPNGIDSEGLRVMFDGTFWVSDEYGPFLTRFARDGRTLERNSPFVGPHPLPLVLARRQPNKGMEGLAAILGGRIFVGMMQDPLFNPDKASVK